MVEESTSSREDISGGGEGILVHNSGVGDVVVSPLSWSWEAEGCARDAHKISSKISSLCTQRFERFTCRQFCGAGERY